MTFLDALRASRACNRPIRQASWCLGHRIQWHAKDGRWVFANRYEPDLLLATAVTRDDWTHRQLDLSRMQGCLTPETMLAEDWEVVP